MDFSSFDKKIKRNSWGPRWCIDTYPTSYLSCSRMFRSCARRGNDPRAGKRWDASSFCRHGSSCGSGKACQGTPTFPPPRARSKCHQLVRSRIGSWSIGFVVRTRGGRQHRLCPSTRINRQAVVLWFQNKCSDIGHQEDTHRFDNH